MAPLRSAGEAVAATAAQPFVGRERQLCAAARCPRARPAAGRGKPAGGRDLGAAGGTRGPRPGVGGAQPAGAGRGLLEFLAELQDRAPLLLVVDDARWANSASSPTAGRTTASPPAAPAVARASRADLPKPASPVTSTTFGGPPEAPGNA